MLGVGLTGRFNEDLHWMVGSRWYLLPEPREFRKDLSAFPGQAISLSASIGLVL